MEESNNKILKYGHSILKLDAKIIKNINEEIVKLIKKMKETLHNVHGAVGLAAPQVGESIQLAIVDPSLREKENEFMVLINPSIIESEGSETENEGCLSIPGFLLPIERKNKLLFKALDINGKEVQKEIDGYIARVIQHEIDHLNGILIIDKVSILKRQLVRREINKLKRNGEW